MRPIDRFEDNGRRSRVVRYGDSVFVTGQVADNKKLDIEGQTREVLAKIEQSLAVAGTDKSKLLTAQIWLASIDDFAAMNSVWDAWVVPDNRPTRCCAEVRLTDPGYLLEVVVTAAR